MKMNSKYLKLFIFLFIINSITLSLYFSSSHLDLFRRHHHHHHSTIVSDHAHLTPVSNSTKPWPILPSYLPWSLNPNLPFRSCEAYFGNGFTRRIDLLHPSPDSHRISDISGRSVNAGRWVNGGGGKGWFRCFYSQTLRSSICEGGRLRMHPEKIKMSSGGEVLESVIGRSEDEELPEFETGAFDLEVGARSKRRGEKVASEGFLNEFVQRGSVSRHTMRDLIDSIRLVGANEFECSEVRSLVNGFCILVNECLIINCKDCLIKEMYETDNQITGDCRLVITFPYL